MNILMMTNTYKPYVGGVERSVTGFTRELRRMGHRVVIVAPESNQKTVPEDEMAPPEEADALYQEMTEAAAALLEAHAERPLHES